ncbi:hypothetical protein L915_05062 [Phytophthora nicotianae]|uniref:Uncharacterized protein n=1 Tax=Phytophthora nicotianae TaxID=4792 RepID=W2H7V2_PHYNI|nr:hypothetical protein L915_05062 [Phytophthora nicotianae]
MKPYSADMFAIVCQQLVVRAGGTKMCNAVGSAETPWAKR